MSQLQNNKIFSRRITGITITLVTIGLFPFSLVNAETGFRESDLSALFSTSKVRNKIDMQRKGIVSSSESTQRISPSYIKVNGIVKRNDGKSIVWLNGRNNMDHATVDGVKVLARQNRSESVAVYVDGKLVRIKPGESWSEDKSDN